MFQVQNMDNQSFTWILDTSITSGYCINAYSIAPLGQLIFHTTGSCTIQTYRKYWCWHLLGKANVYINISLINYFLIFNLWPGFDGSSNHSFPCERIYDYQSEFYRWWKSYDPGTWGLTNPLLFEYLDTTKNTVPTPGALCEKKGRQHGYKKLRDDCVSVQCSIPCDLMGFLPERLTC